MSEREKCALYNCQDETLYGAKTESIKLSYFIKNSIEKIYLSISILWCLFLKKDLKLKAKAMFCFGFYFA